MPVVVVLDCGATNLRAIAIDPQGEIVASHFVQNTTERDEQNSDFHVWNFDRIWQTLIICAQRVIEKVGANNVVGITVTTFGVDGAPFDISGKQLYPVISWKCPRTIPMMKTVEDDIQRLALYQENGIGDYSFNTLYKLHWLQQHQSEIYSKMDKFVFISSMITQKLTGVMTTDLTMAGTSMLTLLKTGGWNQRVLNYLQLTTESFPPLIAAGEQIGMTLQGVGLQLGLRSSVPVVSAGHDTQFALFGSGAAQNQAFLSSGTWEILMARSGLPKLDDQALQKGVTVELDAQKGLYNPAVQWLSSAVVEWVVQQFYDQDLPRDELYSLMVREAEEAGEGAGGVIFSPNFSCDEEGQGQGSLEGLSIHTTRGQIVRAVFEGLSKQLHTNFQCLARLCDLEDGPVVMVGGGTKNPLWNQLRANALQRPLHIVEQTEATVIGAAMFAYFSVGFYSTLQEAQQAMKPKLRVVYPNTSKCCAE